VSPNIRGSGEAVTMPFVVPLDDIIAATKRKVAYMSRGASMHADNVLVFSGAFYVQACISFVDVVESQEFCFGPFCFWRFDRPRGLNSELNAAERRSLHWIQGQMYQPVFDSRSSGTFGALPCPNCLSQILNSMSSEP
jgi:hypothetical protein